MFRGILILILVLLLAWALFTHLPDRSEDARHVAQSPEACVDRTKSEDPREYQQKLAECLGLGNLAGFAGAANFDYARLGRQLLAGSIEPDAYLGAVRDRTAKLRLTAREKTWADAFARGDADRDLVPDERDNCPGTSDLAPTDERGCPLTSLPEAPSAEDVREAREAMHMAVSPACKGAPPPQLSTALGMGRDPDDEDAFLIAVSRVKNQPDDCLILYEVDIRSRYGSFFSQSSGVALFHFVFRPSESIDTSAKAEHRHVFRVRKADIPAWNRLAVVAVEPGDRAELTASVRAINGNGVSGGVSAPRVFEMNFVTYRFVP